MMTMLISVSFLSVVMLLFQSANEFWMIFPDENGERTEKRAISQQASEWVNEWMKNEVKVVVVVVVVYKWNIKW